MILPTQFRSDWSLRQLIEVLLVTLPGLSQRLARSLTISSIWRSEFLCSFWRAFPEGLVFSRSGPECFPFSSEPVQQFRQVVEISLDSILMYDVTFDTSEVVDGINVEIEGSDDETGHVPSTGLHFCGKSGLTFLLFIFALYSIYSKAFVPMLLMYHIISIK